MTANPLEMEGFDLDRYLRTSKRVDLSGVALYSIVAGRRRLQLSELDKAVFRVRHPVEQFLKRVVPQGVKDFAKGLLPGSRAS